MLKQYLPFLLIAAMIVSCGKDKLQTTPSLKLKSINSNELFPGQDLVIELEYRDKEGDLGTGLLTYIRNRLNIKPIQDPASNDKADTITTPLPEFPKTTTGDIELRIVNGFLSEDPFDNDTMTFKIFVKDVGGNTSDTIVTETIVERQN